MHIVFGLPLTLLFANRLGAKVILAGERVDHRAIRYWSHGLCRAFGIRVQRTGQLAPSPVMLLANHLSWIDIQVLHSQRAAVFVGKSEIASWPVFGWMAKAGGTIFLRRGSPDSLNWVAERLAEKLRQGLTVAIFPEAGTGNGVEIRRFHARLLKAAVLADKAFQPVSLRFVRAGRQHLTIPFADNETLVANMWRILGEPACQAQLHFLEPFEPAERGRRELAKQAEQAVRAAYHQGIMSS